VLPQRGACLLTGGGDGVPMWRVKGKTVPLQAWTGPEGSRKLRLPDYKTVGT